jgi:hypothetical protein
MTIGAYPLQPPDDGSARPPIGTLRSHVDGTLKCYDGTNWMDVAPNMMPDLEVMKPSKEYLDLHFGGLEYEAIVEVLKKHYPENFV